MTTFKSTAAAIAAATCLAGGAHAATLNFDDLDGSAGQTVPLTSVSLGDHVFDLSFAANGGALGPALFDTTCSGDCNGDADLKPTSQGADGVAGNVLILQNEEAGVPNDDAQGGSITFTLASGGDFRFTGASAVDDGMFTFSSSLDGELGMVDIAADNETGRATFMSSLLGVGDSFTIGYSGSGGVDSLEITSDEMPAPVPLPAALPLLVGGVLGLGFLGRRRRAA